MNVLILTPDRVGSTLLQRLITIYMNAHDYDKPVINLHELTNGIEPYYSPVYNREVLGKPKNKQWGYYQSLETIVDTLSKVDHYKTARVALYHLNLRQDKHSDRIQFYNYLNENFYIISARRKNLFEHAISWCIFDVSKKLNVFTHDEKIHTFFNIYKNGITVDKKTFTNHLHGYLKYLEWSDTHFHVASYFEYEKHLPNIENYILNLDIWPNQNKKTWNEIFGIQWNDWNRCHKLISDIGATEDLNQIEYKEGASSNQIVRSKLQTSLSTLDQNYLLQHSTKYKEAYNGIQTLINNGALINGVPIKLQTMAEKRMIIKNFDECVTWYNDWVEKNGYGEPYTDNMLKQLANDEVKNWYAEAPKHLLLE